MQAEDAVDASIVIPVHNEASIIRHALDRLISEFSRITSRFEVLVVENGSTDATWSLLEEAAKSEPRIKPYRSPVPDYGRSLKLGLLAADAPKIIAEEIDILDHGFHEAAFSLLDNHDLVIASKRHPEARDNRGVYRRLGTEGITLLLRLGCGLRSSDTHGPKAWRKEAVRTIVATTTLDGDLFASEAVLRAERAGLRIAEVPLSVAERRSSAIPLIKRVPRVLRDIRALRASLKGSF